MLAPNGGNLKNLTKDGERGIAAAFKANGKGHVVNFIKEDGTLKFVDGQNGQLAKFTPDYIVFYYFKTVKL